MKAGVAQARKNPFGADGFLALFQHAGNTFGQDNRADTGVGFRIADRDSAPDRDDLSCNTEPAFRFVQVLPAQSADLTFAQSRHTFEVEEVPPPRFILNDFQKLFELFLVVDFAFRAVQQTYYLTPHFVGWAVILISIVPPFAIS